MGHWESHSSWLRCWNVLRNHNIALSLFKSHIYTKYEWSANAGIPQAHQISKQMWVIFHSCKWKLWIIYTWAGRCAFNSLEDGDLHRIHEMFRRDLLLSGSIRVPTTLSNNRQTVRGRQASLILLSVHQNRWRCFCICNQTSLSTVASLLHRSNQKVWEIF